jgi:hypothetical protein
MLYVCKNSDFKIKLLYFILYCSITVSGEISVINKEQTIIVKTTISSMFNYTCIKCMRTRMIPIQDTERRFEKQSYTILELETFALKLSKIMIKKQMIKIKELL